MRIRTIKPEFWQDEELSEISETARLVAIGLLNCADDEGWFNANEKLISSLLFPLTEPSVSIHECFIQLIGTGYLKLYKCNKAKKIYGLVVNFLKHQKVNRPTPSKIKDLVDFTDNSLNDHGSITVGKERKGTGKGTGNMEQGKDVVIGSNSSEAKASNTEKQNNVLEIFEYWKQVMSKGDASKLTKEREKNVTARLKDGYTVEQIKLSIVGCSKTPHNMGQNENGKSYNDLELICRTGTNLERFATNATFVVENKFNAVTNENINSAKGWIGLGDKNER